MQIIKRYCAKRSGSGDFFAREVYYYRAFIARVFLQYDKGIYIDSDTILMADIGELFDIDLGDNIIAARVDPKVAMVPEFVDYVEKALGIPAKEYVNSGVLLMDLKKLRKIHYITQMTDLIKYRGRIRKRYLKATTISPIQILNTKSAIFVLSLYRR